MHTAKNKPEQVKEMIFPTLLKIAVGRGRSLLPPEKKKSINIPQTVLPSPSK